VRAAAEVENLSSAINLIIRAEKVVKQRVDLLRKRRGKAWISREERRDPSQVIRRSGQDQFRRGVGCPGALLCEKKRSGV
jgi:hypothetical protein